jgi:hypothetical protein
MRDEYVGDIGDFGKYILLNKLSELCGGNTRIGINWYYNDRPSGAFRYLSAMNANKYGPSAKALFDVLKRLVDADKEKLSKIENSSALPKSFIYYRESIPVTRNARARWFQNSMDRLKEANVVFLDPDNGIPYYAKPDKDWIPNIGLNTARAVQYAYMEEIKKYYDRGQSVIVYNHRDMQPVAQYMAKFVLLKRFVGLQNSMPILRFKKFRVRDYLLIPQKLHEGLFQKLSADLASKPYDDLFDRYEI